LTYTRQLLNFISEDLNAIMRNRIEISEPNSIEYQRTNNLFNSSDISINIVKDNPVFEKIASEGCEYFVNYIEWLGLDKDPDLVVLSSMHHYYYDAEEMKRVKSVVNLKELNQIKDLKKFLHSIFHILPQKSYFIGSFVDNKKNNGFELRKSSSKYKNKLNSEAVENGILSKIPFLNMLYSLLDSKTNNFLSRKIVCQLIESHGFKIIDMTDLNNMTFFCAQRIPSNT
jgi:hypothetical protein